MSTFSARRLTAVFAMLVARQGQGFVVPPPSSFAMKALYSTDGDEVASMRAGEIKKELESYGISTKKFLEKGELVDALVNARAQGLTPKTTTATSTTSTSQSTSESSTTSSSTSASREERIKEELEKCKDMKATDLKKELEDLGVSTKSFFEKSEFAQALAEARVNGVEKKPSEGYAEYKNVEVLTDASSGPRPKGSRQEQQQSSSSSPFGGASPFGGGGGASPFGNMGGMGGIADMLKNMGGMGGGATGSANPFGGGMGGMADAMGKAQEMMKNPKVREIIAKAQSNPKMMAAVNECMSNPAAFAKYQNDPEVAGLINELRKYMM
jgi:hypothetical protein